MSASEAPAKPGRVLIVAGSDSGGGAGIQADIKTVTALGQYAMTAVTAITVQNTLGVHGVTPLAPDLIEAQMRACLSDLGADAVKTGMLHDAGTIGAVAASLADLGRGVPLVLDPVMVAKGGAKLIDDTAIEALKRDLFPLAALITPNAPEAAALAGGAPVETLDDLIRTGRMLRTLGPAAVLMKGGHLPGARLFDVLVTEAGETVFESARIETRHTHGTGCTLASAIAAGLAAGLELSEAVRRARDYVREAIRTAPGFGGGHGPLNHMHTVPRWN